MSLQSFVSAVLKIPSITTWTRLEPLPRSYKQDKIRGGKLFHRLATQTGGQVSLRSSAEKVLRTSIANFDHPLWHALWQRRKLQIMNTGTRYEIKRRLDQLQKRINDTRWTQKPTPMERCLKGSSTEGHASSKRPREIRGLETQLERIDNYTFEQAVKDFSAANERSILTCRNFLPVDARSEIEPFEDESVEFLPDYGVPEPVDPSALTVFVASIFREFIESVVYLGPLRENPERHYIFSGNPTEQVGKTGKMVPDILFKDRQLVQRLNQKLETFGVGYTIEVSISERRDTGLTRCLCTESH